MYTTTKLLFNVQQMRTWITKTHQHIMVVLQL